MTTYAMFVLFVLPDCDFVRIQDFPETSCICGLKARRRSGIFIVNFEHISATSHLSLISVWTLRTMLWRYHDVVTGATTRQIYLRRLCDVLLKT